MEKKKEALINNYSTIKPPKNYFKGKGNLKFPIPDNILCFYRNSYERAYADSHKRYVCFFNFGDSVRINIEETLQIINEGEGLILLPFQYHKFLTQRKQDKTAGIFITFDMEETSYFEVFRCNNFKIDKQIMDYLETIFSLYNPENFDQLPYYIGLLLLQISNKTNLISKVTSINTNKNQLIQNIVKLIHKNLHLNIKDISLGLGFSEGYLRNYFKKQMGITLGQYIIDVRISKAMQLLMNSNESISNISYKCGYDSITSFSRIFKQLTKLSPKQFSIHISKHPESYYEFRHNFESKNKK